MQHRHGPPHGVRGVLQVAQALRQGVARGRRQDPVRPSHGQPGARERLLQGSGVGRGGARERPLQHADQLLPGQPLRGEPAGLPAPALGEHLGDLVEHPRGRRVRVGHVQLPGVVRGAFGLDAQPDPAARGGGRRLPGGQLGGRGRTATVRPLAVSR
ncbi:hypothetical protein [Streptomyces sp. DSM 40907]|uniref:hypothetical protein n=1 Tax=Streptomyces kutzneri TaxID=3051179 RepID=UPI0028D31103|nr:hypothetical protein [Streptomyces sp. DSM 40907]